MREFRSSLFAFLLFTFLPVISSAQNAQEILAKSQETFFYAGKDLFAKVKMTLLTEGGQSRTRVLSMFRRNEPDGKNQKYYMYFHEPGDVRRTAFLVWKYPEKDDDRWIFIPAVNMVRRVAAKDSRSSFVGSDFTYEDISGRDLSADEHSFLREEKLPEAECYVIQSVPKGSADFKRKLSWVDKTSFLPIKEEYYDAQNALFRVFSAIQIQQIEAGSGEGKKTFPTIVKRSMKNVKSGHSTEVIFENVSYDNSLEDSIFSERSLENPPRKWIK